MFLLETLDAKLQCNYKDIFTSLRLPKVYEVVDRVYMTVYYDKMTTLSGILHSLRQLLTP